MKEKKLTKETKPVEEKPKPEEKKSFKGKSGIKGTRLAWIYRQVRKYSTYGQDFESRGGIAG